MSKKYFTEQELEDLTKQLSEKILLNSYDETTVKELVSQMNNEWQATHDNLCKWTTFLLSFIGRRYGDKALYEALEESVSSFLKPLLEKLLKSDRKTVVEGMAAAIRGHLGAYSKIEEDEEKFTFTMPCPSGGKLIIDGCYDSNDYLKIKDPQLMTYGRKDFPVYCAHCYFQDVLPIEWMGEPLWLTEPSEDLGKVPCTRYLYKNTKDIPEKFYERLGRKPKK